jgi:O-methyltransferase involved in polyketide biosynthesis
MSADMLDGVSATTLWTLHNRGTKATRSDGVIRDRWAVTLFDTVDYDYRKFGKPSQLHALRARLDRIGFMQCIRPSITLLEFGA